MEVKINREIRNYTEAVLLEYSELLHSLDSGARQMRIGIRRHSVS